MQRRREPAGGLGKKERNTLRLRELAVGRGTTFVGFGMALAVRPSERARVTITRRPLRALKVTLRPQYLALAMLWTEYSFPRLASWAHYTTLRRSIDIVKVFSVICLVARVAFISCNANHELAHYARHNVLFIKKDRCPLRLFLEQCKDIWI